MLKKPINSADINCDLRKREFNQGWLPEKKLFAISRGSVEPQIMDLFQHIRLLFFRLSMQL